MRSLFLVLLLGTAATAQQQHKLTPRELFYTPPAPAAETRPVPVRAKPAKTEKPVAAKPVQQKVAQSGQPAETQVAAIEPVQPEHPVVIPASSSSMPLGLRYSLLKKLGSSLEEVDTATVFRSGDRIRVSVEVNDSGYLYIVNRGSSGAWNVLFPSPEIAGGDNRVVRGQRYEIPSGYTFTFDEQAGTERLFIVVSRRPEPDLDRLIYQLGEKPVKPATPAQPEVKRPTLILAANRSPIDDMLVGRLRNTYARDLIIEKVDESTPGPRKEKAVYTVNTSTSMDARVVADVVLEHR